VERRELDNAMSWLSTLGGAFSALGEEFKHCVSMLQKSFIQHKKCTQNLTEKHSLKTLFQRPKCIWENIRQKEMCVDGDH